MSVLDTIYEVRGWFGDVVWRGHATGPANAIDRAVRARAVRWLDVSQVVRVGRPRLGGGL